MASTIEYKKVLTEMVYINLPGPEEPAAGMSGPEMLHGFLAELHRATSPEIKSLLSKARA